MSRTVQLGIVLVLSAVACVQSQSADRSSGRASDQGIERCFIEAAEASLGLRSLRDDVARSHGSEIRVWLFEPGTTHYFLKLDAVDGTAATGHLQALTLSYSNSEAAAHRNGSAWCGVLGSYVAYQALARDDLSREWQELRDQAEVVLRQQTSPAHSSTYDSPVVVVESRDAAGYRSVVVADFESDSEAVRAARDLRNLVLEHRKDLARIEAR